MNESLDALRDAAQAVVDQIAKIERMHLGHLPRSGGYIINGGTLLDLRETLAHVVRAEVAAVPAMRDVTCWLVERHINGRAAWLHFDKARLEHWTYDAYEADRFSNEWCAGIVAGSFPYTDIIMATEHMFVGAEVAAEGRTAPLKHGNGQQVTR